MAETVGVLFTDLCGSTELAGRVSPERADDLRREHFTLLRGAVAAHAGREVKNLGDGMMLVFDSASDALTCAVTIQQRFELRNRTAMPGEELLVRLGVSMGDVDAEEGDYFGTPVVEAARLCDLAEGGQVLTTEVVRVLAGGRGGHKFEAAGTHELKGLDDPVTVSAVVWEPLAEVVAVADVHAPLPNRLGTRPTLAFVGRTGERERLDERWKSTRVGAGGAVLLSGEAGIGKTTLSGQFARAAHDSGGLVLYGHCDEELRVPYGPWVEAIGFLVAQFSDDELAALLDRDARDVVRLIPGLATRVAGIEPTRSNDPETERYLLHGGVVALLGAVASIRPILVVLDDLQWADRPSLQLLRHLLATGGDLAVLVVGTYRDTDLGADHPLTDALAMLQREERFERIALRGLDDTEVIALMEAVAGHEMTDDGIALAHDLYRETEGNPFFTGEILVHLAESGGIYQQDSGRWAVGVELSELGIPQSVRDVVGRRVRRLGDDTTRTLSAASTMGREFELEVLAEVTEVDEDSLLDRLDDAARAGIVAEIADRPGRYQFAHTLFQETLYTDVSAARRSRWHRRIAEALEARAGPEPDAEHVGELAHHWIEATQPQDAAKAIVYAQRAGDMAYDALASAEACVWYRRALELLDAHRPDDRRTRAGLLARLGTALSDAVDVRASRPHLIEAAGLARRDGDDETLVRAALGLKRGRLGGLGAPVGEHDADAVAVLEAAIDAVDDDSAEYACLTALLAAELSWGDVAQAEIVAQRAEGLALAIEDPELRLVALWSLVSLRFPDQYDRYDALYDEVVRTATELGALAYLGPGFSLRFNRSLESGDRDAIDRWYEAAQSGPQSGGMTEWGTSFQRALVHYLDGDLDTAEDWVQTAFDYAVDGGQPEAFSFYGAQLRTIRTAQGRFGEIADLVRGVAADNEAVPAFRAGLAAGLCSIGEADEAAELLAPDIADGFVAHPRNASWLTGIASSADVVTHLGLEAPAHVLYDLLVPYAGRMVFSGITIYESVDHFLGLLAATLGRDADAEAHFVTAYEMHERLRAPYFMARTQVALAGLLARRGAERDRTRALELATRALEVARERGFAVVERHADALARTLRS